MGLGSSSRVDDDVPNIHTGMTNRQMRTVYKSWKLLKKDRKRHSIMIFVRLFRKYPMYRRYFLDGPGVKMSDLASHPDVIAHCAAFMKAMDRMLDAAYKKPDTLIEILNYQAKCHKDLAVGELECQRVTETVIQYMRNEFPKETTDYVAECWQQYLDMLTEQYATNMSLYYVNSLDDVRKEMIPVHASRKSTANKDRTEKEIWEKQREYWRNKKSTWANSDASAYDIDDEEQEDSYIRTRNKSSRCCGASSSFGEKEKSCPSKKPVVGKEITETRSITTIKEVNIDLDDTGKSVSTEGAGLPTANSRRSDDYSNISMNGSCSLMSEYSTTSEIIDADRSPLDVRIRRSRLPPKYYKRHSSDLFRKNEVVNDKNYVTPSYVPGRNIDDMDIPMPKCFKKEDTEKRSQSVAFESEPRVYEDYSEETVADSPRERRRKWNEFTSCCNKRNS